MSERDPGLVMTLQSIKKICTVCLMCLQIWPGAFLFCVLVFNVNIWSLSETHMGSNTAEGALEVRSWGHDLATTVNVSNASLSLQTLTWAEPWSEGSLTWSKKRANQEEQEWWQTDMMALYNHSRRCFCVYNVTQKTDFLFYLFFENLKDGNSLR